VSATLVLCADVKQRTVCSKFGMIIIIIIIIILLDQHQFDVKSAEFDAGTHRPWSSHSIGKYETITVNTENCIPWFFKLPREEQHPVNPILQLILS
jgi:hypothetical protein